MKRFLIIKSLLLIATMLFFSCKKFLEKPESSEVTLDVVFSTKEKTEQFLWNVYSTASIFEFPYYWTSADNGNHFGALYTIADAATDAADTYADYTGASNLNVGNWNPDNVHWWEFQSYRCYQGIRNANIFIENVDKAPLSDAEKKSMKAEAIFLRALMHFDLMQRLGGVVIVDKVLEVTSAEDLVDLKKPRNTYEETVNFIVKSCEDIAKDLPVSYTSNFRGRIVRAAAYALKARTLLYAASPLFNTNEPYLPAAGPLRAMTGYADGYKAERWQLAANASKQLLDSAGKWAIALYYGKTNPVDRYEEIFINPNVNEIILDAGLMGLTAVPYFVRFMTPGMVVYTGTDPVNIGVTFNFAKFYQKKDGSDQVWDEVPGTAYPYAQYQKKLDDLEPRFQASVFYSGNEWSRGTNVRYHFYEQAGKQLDRYHGVGFLRKFVKGVAAGSSPAPRWITFRLAEFYLNYAEALNEVNGDPSQIEWALAEVRKRVDMPAITYTNQADMRQKIRRERNVELAFEEHRYFDVRRWRIAGQDGVMKGGMWELKLTGGTAPKYTLQKFEDRVWEDKMYLYPFRNNEVKLGYINQNPGW